MNRPWKMYAINIFWAGICLGDRMLDTLSYGDDMLKVIMLWFGGNYFIKCSRPAAAGISGDQSKVAS